MADDDDVVYPLTDNDDLIAAGLLPEDDDDIHDDAAALLGIDVGSGSALINLDGGDGGGGAELVPLAMVTLTPVGSNSTNGTSCLGKRKSGVWVDFDKNYETMNGQKEYCNAKGVRPRKFDLDMDVRWNSTYLMLKHLVPYKNVFSMFINSHYGSQLLTTNHWYFAEKLLEFLKLFYYSTIVLSGVYYPTSPLVLHHIIEIASHLHACEKDHNLRGIVLPMKLKFLKYWQDIPLLYSYAFILDPRAKMRGFFNVLQLLDEYTSSEYSSYYANVKIELYKLFNKYESKFGAARSQWVAQPSHHIGKKRQAWGRIFGRGSGVVGPSPLPVTSSSSTSVVSELSAYLDSDNVTSYEDDFDLLLWWRDHKLIFPILSIMARDILSVPISTVSLESCFSLTGRIIEERWQRLSPETVEMLTCLKD
ncbi:zinc finger BED domain-containing protein RICESLEEPER 2-like [Miscanthus floridulus]|uniref:zinc finger BED domain-containing protein RICESLEEPER 2-like n=1 Tax=Miscanthus floridulus TaxID=154761 RepID=UPI003458BABE